MRIAVWRAALRRGHEPRHADAGDDGRDWVVADLGEQVIAKLTAVTLHHVHRAINHLARRQPLLEVRERALDRASRAVSLALELLCWLVYVVAQVIH